MAPSILTLREDAPSFFPREAISEADAEQLWREFPNVVALEYPSPRTNDQWRLTSQGYVGYIPLSHSLHISLQPKVLLGNLFRMWAYAYALDVRFLSSLFQCETLRDAYEQLAAVLAQRVLGRARSGLYRSYESHREQLPVVRGRIDVPQAVRHPQLAHLPCTYEGHTPNNKDNQILAWTLHHIARSGLCGSGTQLIVQRARRALAGWVSLRAFAPRDCIDRSYHRLNQDYAPLHALCRFFLDDAAPTHLSGQQPMLPFLVDMSALFEQFVAAWLQQHMPAPYTIKTQESVELGSLRPRIDLVWYHNGTPLCVLDTKYKAVTQPDERDIYQVMAYADFKGCHEAVLIYPSAILPFNIRSRSTRVRTLAFDLSGDLDAAGQKLVSKVLGQ
jgi:5-methylcytosine-specific restriction enzyme subunit McrC